MNFAPPIAERETDELIIIANFPDEWNPLAVEQAKMELLVRNVSVEYEHKRVAVVKRYKEKQNILAAKRRANESFKWHEFIFNFSKVLVVMLCDWDMKKDGYIKKHQQRKYTFAAIGLFIVVVYLLIKLKV